MKAAKYVLILLFVVVLLGPIMACTDDASVGPERIDSAAVAHSTTPPPNAPWLSDYFPTNPHQFGIRTYYWYDEEDYLVAFINGTETVPYASGPIEATKLFLEDEDIGFYVDRRELWLGVIQDEYYVSVDCALTAFPFPVAGKVWDGMYMDVSGLPAFLVKKDRSECIPMPGNDRLTLFKIDDVNILGERYNNALILWSLEPAAYQPLDFGGYEDEWGITLPTGAETHGNAVDGFVIFAFRKGLVALGEVSVDEGDLDDLALLVSEVPTASVPVVWATGGGTIIWGGTDRVTYGFNATLDMGGDVRGMLQFNWRDNDSKWHGAIDCLSVDGNQAYASGIFTSGDFAGMYFTFGVRDNGEGATATGPDRISYVIRSATPWDCHDHDPSIFKSWTNGNVQIKIFR